jgi:nicotinamide riboside kinase
MVRPRGPHAQRRRTGRPLPQEQARRVLTALDADVVIADTTPLMTAVYSHLLFDDESLYDFALAHQRIYDATLVTGLDLPWVADGLQRDGPKVREPVDALLRTGAGALRRELAGHLRAQERRALKNALKAI